MVKDSALWVVETIAAADRKKQGAEQRIKYYKDALQAYSGGIEAVAAISGRPQTPAPSQGANATQSQMPIDESFINRIMAMSEFNTRYRQKLTDAMVTAQLEAVSEDQRASYYRRLQASVNGPGAPGDAEDLSAKLDEI